MPLAFPTTLGFFKASKNSRDRSMLSFMEAMVVPFGSLMSLRMPQ